MCVCVLQGVSSSCVVDVSLSVGVAVQDFFHLPSMGLAGGLTVPAAGLENGVDWGRGSPLYIWTGSPLWGDWVAKDARSWVMRPDRTAPCPS